MSTLRTVRFEVSGTWGLDSYAWSVGVRVKRRWWWGYRWRLVEGVAPDKATAESRAREALDALQQGLDLRLDAAVETLALGGP
jgi:hypothetical protein